MAQSKNSDISVECPCCGARLSIDAKLLKVVSSLHPLRSGTLSTSTRQPRF